MEEQKEKSRRELIGPKNPKGPGPQPGGAASCIAQYVWFGRNEMKAHSSLMLKDNYL